MADYQKPVVSGGDVNPQAIVAVIAEVVAVAVAVVAVAAFVVIDDPVC